MLRECRCRRSALTEGANSSTRSRSGTAGRPGLDRTIAQNRPTSLGFGRQLIRGMPTRALATASRRTITISAMAKSATQPARCLSTSIGRCAIASTALRAVVEAGGDGGEDPCRCAWRSR